MKIQTTLDAVLYHIWTGVVNFIHSQSTQGKLGQINVRNWERTRLLYAKYRTTMREREREKKRSDISLLLVPITLKREMNACLRY